MSTPFDELIDPFAQMQLNTNEVASAIYSDIDRDLLRYSLTISMIRENFKKFHGLFNPTNTTADNSAEMDSQTLLERLQLRGEQDPTSLLAKASEYVSNDSVPSFQTTSENRTSNELMVRVGMVQRPQYFILNTEEENSGEAGYIIFAKFMCEFAQQGALDYWINYFHEIINNKETDSTTREAIFELAELIANRLKFMVSDAAKDPAQDPLNKYCDRNALKRAIELRKWLHSNSSDDPDYYKNKLEFNHLDTSLKSSRHKSINEGIEYLFGLFRRINPEWRKIETPNEMTACQEAESKKRERQVFETHVVDQYGKRDLFEPNALRAFWEKLNRYQYGKICYQFLCESFAEEYSTSRAHQIVREMWAVSQLDTINDKPHNASSRMPSASFDGKDAPNFGYKIGVSASYQEWLKNPHARNHGDIVMDAYHSIVDFGKALDVEVFLSRFKLYILDENSTLEERLYNPHKYDEIMLRFILYLLKNEYHTPYVVDLENIKPLFCALINAAGSFEILVKTVRDVLNEFKSFVNFLFSLRPSDQMLSQDGRFGFVFGVGFNGSLFGVPDNSKKEKNEIFLTFSDAGRNRGGYLFLYFLKDNLKSSHFTFTKFIDVAPHNLTRLFTNYRLHIQYVIKQRVKSIKKTSNWAINTEWLETQALKQELYEGFMSQLELEIPYEQLDNKFKQWIKETKNWYCVPQNIKIKIPVEMPKDEHMVQEVARELLFDALTQRLFSKEHPNLMLSLFLNWKTDLVEFFQDNNDFKIYIQAVNHLDDIPQFLRKIVEGRLDFLVHQVHPELKQIWLPAINAAFQRWKLPKQKKIDQDIDQGAQKIKNIEKSKLRNGVSNPHIEINLREAQQELNDLKQKKQALPQVPAQLSIDEYLEFRNSFFEGRSVSQCVEPLFARVLGHDRFFSIFLSKKVLQTVVRDHENSNLPPLQLGNRIPQDVIAPCDKRCQFNALGHLTVGEFLSPQSADILDKKRKVHHMEGVPDNLLSIDRLRYFRHESTALKSNNNNNLMLSDNIEQPNVFLTQYKGFIGTATSEPPANRDQTKGNIDI